MRKSSLPRKTLEVLLGLVHGTVEHSFVLPTAIRKDFHLKAKPEDIKLSKDHDIGARQIGYFHSFVTPPWPLTLTLVNMGMYKGVYEVAPELVTTLAITQIGLNIGSLAYEIVRGIKKGSFKAENHNGYYLTGLDNGEI